MRKIAQSQKVKCPGVAICLQVEEPISCSSEHSPSLTKGEIR